MPLAPGHVRRPRRASRGAGQPHPYIGRAPALREPFDDPKRALADRLVMLADAPGALAEFNRVIDLGAIDINLVTPMVIPNVSTSDHPALAGRTR